MEQGFVSTVEITLKEGETPESYLKFEKHEIIIPDKYYGPYICFYWEKYVFTNHKDEYAVKFIDYKYDLKDLESYCPCPPCEFFRRPKSCSIDWFYGFIRALITCRGCCQCLKGGERKFEYIEIAYNKKNE